MNYYVYNSTDESWKEVTGEPITIFKWINSLLIRKDDEDLERNWKIDDKRSGCLVAWGATRNEAMMNLYKLVEDRGHHTIQAQIKFREEELAPLREQWIKEYPAKKKIAEHEGESLYEWLSG